MRRLGVLAVLLGLAILMPTSALSDVGGTNRPFKSSSVGVTTVHVLTGQLQNSSSGTASHVGLFMRQDAAQVIPHPGAPSGYDGSSTLTAANGDQITMHCVGTSTTPDAGVHSTSVLTCTLADGTGRFSDVSGSITTTSHSTMTGFDGATMTATYASVSSADGWISY